MGTLLFTVLYQYPGMFAWIILNTVLATFLNQARKAQQSEKYDDRLSTKRMEEAQNWIMRRWKQK
jgi:hypothetical protein